MWKVETLNPQAEFPEEPARAGLLDRRAGTGPPGRYGAAVVRRGPLLPPLELPEHEKDTEMQGDQAGGTFENKQEPRDAPKATRDN